jgi:hypothetical protein
MERPTCDDEEHEQSGLPALAEYKISGPRRSRLVCHAHRMAVYAMADSEGTVRMQSLTVACEECATAIYVVLDESRPPPRFCSDACRQRGADDAT